MSKIVAENFVLFEKNVWYKVNHPMTMIIARVSKRAAKSLLLDFTFQGNVAVSYGSEW